MISKFKYSKPEEGKKRKKKNIKKRNKKQKLHEGTIVNVPSHEQMYFQMPVCLFLLSEIHSGILAMVFSQKLLLRITGKDVRVCLNNSAVYELLTKG